MKKTKKLLLIIGAALALSLIAESASSQTIITDKNEKSTLIRLAEGYTNLAQDSLLVSSPRDVYEIFAPSGGSAFSNYDFFDHMDRNNFSSLSFRKELSEKKSFTKTYEIEFGEKQNSMKIDLGANAIDGLIKITIYSPNGKIYKSIEVEDNESFSWDQSINAYSDEKKNEYAGTWEVIVEAKNARGRYNVKLSVR